MLDWFYLVLPSLKGKGDRVSGGRVLSVAYALEGFDKLLKEGLEHCNNVSDDVDYYIRAISRKSDENSVSAEKDVELLATLVFREIIGKLFPEACNEGTSRGNSKHIGAIETFINANFRQKITLSDVANQVYLSTRQVSRILKQEYGCTLSELVNQKKLASAQMLLKNTDMKIGDIARQVNLGSENYFYSLFKKRYGVSPLKYRKQHDTRE